MIAHAHLLADGLDTREMRLQPLQILFASQLRIDVKIATRFHVMKEHRFVEVKTQFSRIEHVEHDDLMAARAEG